MTVQRNNPTGRERQKNSGAEWNSAATIFYGASVHHKTSKKWAFSCGEPEYRIAK
jgi:hypothetical protein